MRSNDAIGTKSAARSRPNGRTESGLRRASQRLKSTTSCGGPEPQARRRQRCAALVAEGACSVTDRPTASRPSRRPCNKAGRASSTFTSRRKVSGLDNAAIAVILSEIADLLEIKGENPFKIRAYRNVADIASNHPH